MMIVLIYVVVLLFSVVQCRPPHILFLLADDLGWNDVSFHGSKQIPTPNIDRLAKSGIILNNYYVAPVCTPSRAALLTGKHQIHTGLQHGVLYPSTPYGLSLNEKILPEWLAPLGYSSYATGKWHLGFFRHEYTPTYRGFKSFRGFWTGSEDYYSHVRRASAVTEDWRNRVDESFWNSDFNLTEGSWGYDMRQNMEVDYNSSGKYSTDTFTEEALRVINSHDPETPMFLYVAYQCVHVPYQAPQQIVDRFSYIKDKGRRIYAAMAYLLDQSVGKIFKSLHKKGMLQDTIIVFSTDNGGPAASIGAASNWPLRGTKWTLWEGGVRGAGFVWSPLLKKRNRVASQLMHIQDWLPTLYSAAGGNVKDLGNIDGIDVWDSINEDQPSPRKKLLLNIDDFYHTAAVRVGDWKLVMGTKKNGSLDGWYGPSGRNCSKCGYVSKKLLRETSHVETILHKMNMTTDLQDVEVSCGPKPENASSNCLPAHNACLFNLKKDPCEYNNLAERYPSVLNKLRIVLDSYNRTAVPPRNKPIDPRANPKYYNHVWTNWMG